MKFSVIIEKGENSYGGYVPDLPGCAVVGETEEETLRLLKEAIKMHIESLKEDGKEIELGKSVVRELELV